MMDRARSPIVLRLMDKVLRGDAKETTTMDMYERLESLYMTKSLPHEILKTTTLLI